MIPVPPSWDDEVVNIEPEGPGDNTIRPCPPERRPILERERELLRLYGKHEEGPDGQVTYYPPDDICVDFEGPGDNTIRPCPPERRAVLEKEREQRRLWEEARVAQLAPLLQMLPSCQETVTHFRNRADLSPDVHLPNLATSLISLGNAQREFNRPEEALGHYRELAKQRPEVYLSCVAMTLDTLAKAQHDLKRREEALASYREANDIRRTLTQP